MAEQQKTAQARRKTVTLKRPHTHRRVACKAGEEIEVPAHVADSLIKRGIAK